MNQDPNDDGTASHPSPSEATVTMAILEDLRPRAGHEGGSTAKVMTNATFWGADPTEVGKLVVATTTLPFVIWSAGLSLFLSSWMTSVDLMAPLPSAKT
jgi:hypothetical protein